MFLSYKDDEVRDFHPVCQEALERALSLIKKSGDYKVAHHEPTGSLIMDFAIQNRATGKYLCVIEVKKTRADVQSARNQLQAMNYVSENGRNTERPFYVLTNLESAALFRHDPARPRVYQQLIQPGIVSIGSFTEEKDAFIARLASFFADTLQKFLRDDYDYLLSLANFADHMAQIKDLPKLWNSHLAVFMYQYVNGVLAGLKKPPLPDPYLFRNDIEKICAAAQRLNLGRIFDYSPESFENLDAVSEYPMDDAVLQELFEFGRKICNGNSIAEVLADIVSADDRHEGEVSTDPELARIAAELALHESGPLGDQELVCDPAAGIGNLLEAAISAWNLKPSQILANELKPQLADACSLKLGLDFAAQPDQPSSIRILRENLADLRPEQFSNVKVALLNPPFIAGIDCVDRKEPFYKAIEKISGKPAETRHNQMQFEAVFLELLVNLLQPGTTVACILPNTHLTASGGTAQKIRNFLLKQFGLRMIFTYPGEQLFNSVIKDTCVIVGRVKSPATSISILASSLPVPQIGLDAFARALDSDLDEEFRPIMSGIQARKAPFSELEKKAKDGWRMLNAEMLESVAFIQKIFGDSPSFLKFSEMGYENARGKSANDEGGSDLIFIDSQPELYGKFSDSGLVCFNGLRSSRNIKTLDIGSGDRHVPNLAATPAIVIDEIIQEFMKLAAEKPDKNKQPRKPKSAGAWRLMLEAEQANSFPANSVLFPRALRRHGKVAMMLTPMHVSTNFLVVSPPSYEDALLLATFASTILFQLMCEVFSKNQEGLRKMEIADFQKTWLPNFRKVPPDMIAALQAQLHNFNFLELDSPKIRPVDKIWATYLFGEEADAILEQASRLLSFLTFRRRPYRPKNSKGREEEE